MSRRKRTRERDYTKEHEVTKLKMRQRKERLVHAKGNRCQDCGVRLPYFLFDFHHRNPEDKKFALSGPNMKRPWKAIAEEARKCDLLCCICHRMRHTGIVWSHHLNSYWEDN